MKQVDEYIHSSSKETKARGYSNLTAENEALCERDYETALKRYKTEANPFPDEASQALIDCRARMEKKEKELGDKSSKDEADKKKKRNTFIIIGAVSLVALGTVVYFATKNK